MIELILLKVAMSALGFGIIVACFGIPIYASYSEKLGNKIMTVCAGSLIVGTITGIVAFLWMMWASAT